MVWLKNSPTPAISISAGSSASWCGCSRGPKIVRRGDQIQKLTWHKIGGNFLVLPIARALRREIPLGPVPPIVGSN